MNTKKFIKLSVTVCIVSIILGVTLGFFTGVVYTSLPDVHAGISKNMRNGQNKDSSDQELMTGAKPENMSGEVYVIKKNEPSVVALTSIRQGNNFFNMIYETEDNGSGVIFHETQDMVYIVTTCNAIENASSVLVSVDGSDSVNASLVGKDQNSDLSVLSISKHDLAKVGVDYVVVPVFGDSDLLEMGDPVIAIGNAFGEGNTATKGIISDIDKKVTILRRNLNVIQTDLAINHGNNGGALINKYGEIIGINTARLSDNYLVEGMSYSIAANDAKKVIEQIMNNEGTPFLGVHISNITDEMAVYFDIMPLGVFVDDVIEGSSAQRSGIQKNDIITGFNDKPIFSVEQFIEAMKECSVGDTVEIKIIRGGKETLTIKAVLSADKDTSF